MATSAHCPPGTVEGLLSDECYFYDSDTTAVWQAASEKCAERGGRLASPNNDRSNAFLLVLPNIRYEEESYWLGGRADNAKIWRWQNGTTPSYTNWGKDQPVLYDAEGSCLAINSTSGHWLSLPCSRRLPCICTVPSDRDRGDDGDRNSDNGRVSRNCLPGWQYSDATYMCHNITEPLSFDDAKTTCESYGGHLVSVPSAEASTFLSTMAHVFHSNFTSFWIGLYAVEDAPCRWTWLDNSKMKFSNWKDGNTPTKCADKNRENWTHIYAASRCALMDVDRDHQDDYRKCQWGTANCFEDFPAICQTAPIETPVNGTTAQ